MKKLFIFILLLILLSGFSSAACVGNTCSLLEAHKYPFNNDYDDDWGVLDGTGQNSPTFVNDRAGNSNEAVNLDGINQYITTSSSSIIDANADWTILFRDIRIDDDTLSGAATLYGEYQDDNNRWGFDFQGSTSEGIRFFYRSGGSTLVDLDCSYDFTNGNWYNLSLTKSGNNYYFDINQNRECSLSDADALSSNTGSVYIGAFTFSSPKYFDGVISEIDIWTDDLSQETLYNYTLNGIYQPGATISYFTVTAKTNVTKTDLLNFTTKLTSDNFTQTISTTNGTIYFDIAENNYNINVTSGGYAFFSEELININNTEVYTAYLHENNSVWLNIFDGISLSLLTNLSFNIIADAQTISYYDEVQTTNGTYYLNNLDQDQYKFTFYNDDYPRQSYFLTLQDNEHKDLNVFLLNDTFVSNVVVTVIDPYGVKVENAVLTMQQNIAGSWTTVSQETTDATGQSLFYLRIGTNYRVLITKTGYTTQTATITPTINPYTVTLELSPLTTYNYTYPYSCIDSIDFFPSDSRQENTTTSFNLSIFSASGSLSYFGVYYNSTIQNNNTVSPTGGSSNISLNLETNNEYVIYYFFKCSGFSEYRTNRTFFVDNLTLTNNTLIYVLSENDNQITLIQKISIIIFSIIVGFLISYELNLPKKAYSLVAISILILFTIPQVAWIDIKITSFLSILFLIPLITSWRSDVYG